MKIMIEVEIFDDHEYCDSQKEKITCEHVEFRNGKNYCGLFKEFTVYGENFLIIKCDQCKEACKRGIPNKWGL